MVLFNTQKFRFFVFSAFLVFCRFSLAGPLYSTVIHPAENRSYKDSFYFVDGNTKYLAVSDLERGGVSLLKAYGNNDWDYRFHKRVIKGNHWAPTVVSLGNGNFLFVTSSIASIPSNSRLKYFIYNINNTGTLNESSASDLNLSGGEAGMIDAYMWYEPSRGNWYLIGSKWQPGVPGSRLQWAKLDSNSPIRFSFPIDLYNRSNGYADWQRVDWGIYGHKIDWVVEAPIRSIWNRKLYWSIGPSEVCRGKVAGIRSGAINWNGNTPWINVDNGLMTSNNMDCGLLTHPDFTATGRIRATSHKNGKYRIVNHY